LRDHADYGRMSIDYQLTLSDGEALRITLYGDSQIDTSPVVIYVHGFKGFKDWGWGPYIGEYLSSKGYRVITFNFSHNGIGEQSMEFTELEKFAENTFSREVRELSELIDAYSNGFFGDQGGAKPGLIGHSRGGAISLLAAVRNPEINAVVTWSSVCRLDRYSEEQKESWRKVGYFEVINQRTGQVMRLNKSLLEDVENHRDDRLNVEKAVKSLTMPLAIFHGVNDESVSLAEGRQLYEWSDHKLTQFVQIPDAGHTFNVSHPFTGSNPAFEAVLAKTESFLKPNLQ